MPKKPTRMKVGPGIWRIPAGTYEVTTATRWESSESRRSIA